MALTEVDAFEWLAAEYGGTPGDAELAVKAGLEGERLALAPYGICIPFDAVSYDQWARNALSELFPAVWESPWKPRRRT